MILSSDGNWAREDEMAKPLETVDSNGKYISASTIIAILKFLEAWYFA